MARRRLLTDVPWEALLSPQTAEREIIRHYTLGDEDLAAAASKRSDHNRIGFPLTLCYLRFPGRAIADVLPASLFEGRFESGPYSSSPKAGGRLWPATGLSSDVQRLRQHPNAAAGALTENARNLLIITPGA